MKRIFTLIFAALMVLGAVSCDKDKGKNKGVNIFSESDLIGYWACTKDLDDGTENPSYSLSVSADHRIFIDDDGEQFEGGWAIKKNKLVLSGEDFEGWDVTLKELDGKHFVWDANWGEENHRYQEAYTNISRTLPGAWKNVGPDAWHVVTIDESGTSIWKKNGTDDAGTLDWYLSIDSGRVIIYFGDENSTWSDRQTIIEVSDNLLKVKSNTETTETFERLGTGGWEVESDSEGVVSFPLCCAWYYYDEGRDGYDICFSDVPDFSNRKESNWAYVDLPKSLCGEEHSLTDGLDTYLWSFYGSTKTLYFSNGDFSSGTIFLSIDEEKKTATLRLDGVTEEGNKIKINYEGPVEQKDDFAYPYA